MPVYCLRQLVRVAVPLVLPLCVQATGPAQFNGASPLEWSRRMADSEMARRGDTMFLGGAPRARWDYTTTLLGLALLRLAERTGHTAYADYGAKTAESYLKPDGEIQTYKRADYNIDMIAGGKVLLLRYEQGHRDARLRTAIETLRTQLREQPRTGEGGFWHKLRYPHQMWLDGVFMAAPFYAHYARVFDEPAAFDDVARQVLLMDRRTYDARTGLWHHAWDEKRAQPWADRETGRSPHFWGRAIGWYGMALVDVLDFLPPHHADAERIRDVLRRMADGIVRWQDASTGLWWQILDQGARPGNYLESSVSCMFVYTLAKAVKRGHLPRENYLPAASRGYAGIIRDFIRTDAGGRVSLTRCCEVAGLGFTNTAGRARDGSFEYYVSEPIVDNDYKGTGPFIMAGLEMPRARP